MCENEAANIARINCVASGFFANRDMGLSGYFTVNSITVFPANILVCSIAKRFVLGLPATAENIFRWSGIFGPVGICEGNILNAVRPILVDCDFRDVASYVARRGSGLERAGRASAHDFHYVFH